MKQATFTPFPADWARSSHFQYYTKGFVKSVNSMTVRIDVTHFLAEVKRRNLKFFPAFAALTGQVIASHPRNVYRCGRERHPRLLFLPQP